MYSKKTLLRKVTLLAATTLVATSLIQTLTISTTQQQTYAQETSGDRVITDSSSNSNEATQTSIIDCGGDNCNNNVNQAIDDQEIPRVLGPCDEYGQKGTSDEGSIINTCEVMRLPPGE